MKHIHPRGMIMRFVNIFAPYLSDALYLRIKYFVAMGKPLRLKHPRTFNEKLQWLKLYNRRPEYTTMVDKVKAKEYVAKIIGEEHIIPTLGVWDSPDDIDFDKLPNQFVLKCNHDSGGLYICRDKSKMDVEQVKENLRKALNNDFFLYSREWPYKNVERKILAEKFMVDESGTELKDYKVFCFDGEPELIEVDFDRFVQHKRNIYGKSWDLIDMEIQYPSDSNHVVARPEALDDMLDLARKLSKGIPHVRTDFYSIGGKLYWGELTFFHGSGVERFRPQNWDEKLGELIVLPPPFVNNCYLIKGDGFALFIKHEKPKAELNDYKFYCFDGKVGFMLVSNDRSSGKTKFDYFDPEFNHLPFTQGGENYDGYIERPFHFDEMKKYAEMLSKGIPHVRVDFYQINGRVYFGELTFFDDSGFAKFNPQCWDEYWGNKIRLPLQESKNKQRIIT